MKMKNGVQGLRRWPQAHRNIRTGTATLLFVAVFGTIMVWAQTSVAWFGFNAESGSFTGQAQVVSDATAAGGAALRFAASTGVSPLPTGNSWINVTSNLAGMPAACGQTYSLHADPFSNRIIVGISRHGEWTTENAGASWFHLGDGAGSEVVANDSGFVLFDPVHPGVFWQAGMHVDRGVYKTSDNGNTFQHLGEIYNIDVLGVDFTDPNRQTIVAGPHETADKLFKSTNGGQTWTDLTPNMPPNLRFTNNPVVINSQTYVVSANNGGWVGSVSGMYRTTNGGQSWVKTSDLAGNHANPMVGKDGTIYYPTGSSMLRSTDQGVTWTDVAQGMNWAPPAEMPDGRILAVINGRMAVSADRGTTWTGFGPNVPFNVWQTAYKNGAVYIEQWDCTNNVLPNALMKLQ